MPYCWKVKQMGRLWRDGYCHTTHLHQIRVAWAGPSPTLAKHRKAGVCLIIWSKISELKVEARGREGRGHTAARRVVRHDLPKSGAAKPQGHPLVLQPVGAGRPTINLLCTLNPFNTHCDPDEEITPPKGEAYYIINTAQPLTAIMLYQFCLSVHFHTQMQTLCKNNLKPYNHFGDCV